VWEVLSDGWLYPLWVVGASRMREVDGHWPQVGSRIHHSIGAWPVLLDDETEVVSLRTGSLIVLRVRARPWGEAEVRITLEALGAGTEITIEEDVTSGLSRLVPVMLRALVLGWRNTETLRRLAHIVERRPAGAERPE
jgi:hypothetical protein